MDDNNQFDIIILGTGITNSIVAAALSKAGLRIAHIDSNQYYGNDEATLTVDELTKWADYQQAHANPQFSDVSYTNKSLLQTRQYSVCLCPSLNTSVGPIISALVASGVSKYNGFKLLEPVALYDKTGSIIYVPSSKEDVFKNKEISLADKRRLMRFLMFAAAGNFGDKTEVVGKEEIPFEEFLEQVFFINKDITPAIAYALAFCTSSKNPTLPALQRIHTYLRSTGRYGASPFLIAHYGGIGEIVQGFCRAAAVGGAIYILGRKITSIDRRITNEDDPYEYFIHLDGIVQSLSSRLILASPAYLPMKLREVPVDRICLSKSQKIARCIAIVDKPIVLGSIQEGHHAIGASPSNKSPEGIPEDPLKHADAAVLVFPPGSLPGGSTEAAATLFINGEGCLATPAGKWIIYITLPLAGERASPKSALVPYLERCLLATEGGKKVEALFTLFYSQTQSESIPNAHKADETMFITPPLPLYPLPDIPNVATQHAEEIFWSAVRKLGLNAHTLGSSPDVIDSFWPSQEVDDREYEEW